MVSITPREVRKFATILLDDENGIKEDAYFELVAMLQKTENCDIINAVDITEGRAYIGEDIAEEILNDMDEFFNGKEE